MARPKSKDKNSKRLTLYFTEAEMKFIEIESKKINCPKASYVKRRFVKSKVTFISHTNREVRRQLIKIGNDLIRVIKRLNILIERGTMEENDLKDHKEEILKFYVDMLKWHRTIKLEKYQNW